MPAPGLTSHLLIEGQLWRHARSELELRWQGLRPSRSQLRAAGLWDAPAPTGLPYRERLLRHWERPEQALQDLLSQPLELPDLRHHLLAEGALSSYLWQAPQRIVTCALAQALTFLCGEPDYGEGPPLAWASLWSQRPRSHNWEFRQQPCCVQASWARAQRILDHHPGGPILVLGDDDLISLALDRQAPPEVAIDVLEIDADLVEFLSHHASPRVRLRRADLFEGLPAPLRLRFASVVTDPMYEWEGMERFLQCAQQGLQPQGRLWLSTDPQLHEMPGRYLDWLAGWEPRAHWPNFNRYPFPSASAAGLVEGLKLAQFEPTWLHDLLTLPWLYGDFSCFSKPSR